MHKSSISSVEIARGNPDTSDFGPLLSCKNPSSCQSELPQLGWQQRQTYCPVRNQSPTWPFKDLPGMHSRWAETCKKSFLRAAEMGWFQNQPRYDVQTYSVWFCFREKAFKPTRLCNCPHEGAQEMHELSVCCMPVAAMTAQAQSFSGSCCLKSAFAWLWPGFLHLNFITTGHTRVIF